MQSQVSLRQPYLEPNNINTHSQGDTSLLGSRSTLLQSKNCSRCGEPIFTQQQPSTNNNNNNNNNNSNNGKELPYDMLQGNVNGISIKLYGSEPTIQWTTGMKCLLTNVKWLLAYSSAHLQSASAPSSVID